MGFAAPGNRMPRKATSGVLSRSASDRKKGISLDKPHFPSGGFAPSALAGCATEKVPDTFCRIEKSPS